MVIWQFLVDRVATKFTCGLRTSLSAVLGGALMIGAASPVISMPTITIKSPIEGMGVKLLSSSSREFQEALSSNKDRSFDDLLKYTALLKNETDKSIVAYDILWVCTDASGVINTSENAWFDFSEFPSASHLRPHNGKLTTPFGSDLYINPVIDLPIAFQMIESQEFFDRQASVEIVLSAVLFSDGTAAGPDLKGWISRWKAHMDAERDVFVTALQSPSGALQTAVDKYVQTGLSGVIRLPQSSRGVAKEQVSYGAFYQAFARENGFDRQYIAFAAAAATEISESLKTRSESSAREGIGRSLARKQFPKIVKVDTPGEPNEK